MKNQGVQTRKQRVLSAAVTLFLHTHDVKKVSLETIAREAKVSPATIYNNFGTREKLLYEVSRVLVKENIEQARNLMRSAIPFPQKITGIINNKLGMMSEINQEVLNKLVTQDKSIAPILDEVYQSEIVPLWKEMLADGKKQGYIDKSLDDEALLIYLEALKIGFAARPDILKGFKDKMELIEQLSQIMFYGFLKKKFDLFKKEAR